MKKKTVILSDLNIQAAMRGQLRKAATSYFFGFI